MLLISASQQGRSLVPMTMLSRAAQQKQTVPSLTFAAVHCTRPRDVSVQQADRFPCLYPDLWGDHNRAANSYCT